MRLPSLSHHLAEAGGYHSNEGGRFLWLPVLDRLFLRHRPRFQGVNDRAGRICCFQHLQCLMDHSHLLGSIVRLA